MQETEKIIAQVMLKLLILHSLIILCIRQSKKGKLPLVSIPEVNCINDAKSFRSLSLFENLECFKDFFSSVKLMIILVLEVNQMEDT